MFRSLTVSKSKLLYNWRFTANHFVLVAQSLEVHDQRFFLQLNPYGHSPYITSRFIYTTFKNSVRTSQETHYVSATKPNRLMLFIAINSLCAEWIFFNVKGGGISINHYGLRFNHRFHNF
jgi:hypothetical protein